MTPDQAARAVIADLGQRGQTLGTCESLTGGGVAHTLTGVAGASAVFRGALVTYASDLKTTLAGVDAAHAAEHGVVNEVVARQMAHGARTALGVDWALSLTGVAGPTEQDGQPVGTVWIGLVGPGIDACTEHHFAGDRAAIREAAIASGLAAVLDWVCSGFTGRQHHASGSAQE